MPTRLHCRLLMTVKDGTESLFHPSIKDLSNYGNHHRCDNSLERKPAHKSHMYCGFIHIREKYLQADIE